MEFLFLFFFLVLIKNTVQRKEESVMQKIVQMTAKMIEIQKRRGNGLSLTHHLRKKNGKMRETISRTGAVPLGHLGTKTQAE